MAESVQFNVYAAVKGYGGNGYWSHRQRSAFKPREAIVLIESNHDIEMLKWADIQYLKQRILGVQGTCAMKRQERLWHILLPRARNSSWSFKRKNNFPELALRPKNALLEKSIVQARMYVWYLQRQVSEAIAYRLT